MKFLVLAVIVACASADVAHLSSDYTAPIVKSSYDINPDGSYQNYYETGNGIYSQSEGVVKNPNADNAFLEVRGSFKYTAPDGTPVETSYVADEEGFKPVGSHIPVPPEVPEHVVRSLAYIAAHPPKVEAVPYQKSRV